MPTFPIAQLNEFAQNLIEKAGATADEARTVGESLVEADACGYSSHGMMRIPFYVDMLQKGDIVSGVPLDYPTSSNSLLVADANWGFGRVQMGRLLDRAIEQTAQSGSTVATLRRSSHVGRLGEYNEIAAAAGLVSILVANTHGAARRVAPPGGIAPRLGTNPMAFGVPYEKSPIVLDFSTSATAEGKVRVKKIAGEPCPDGWLLDSAGQPTTDPESLYANPPGTILPMGGSQTYKGFGLALMVDILAGALSGGLCAREVPETPKGNCVFMMLVDPAAMGGLKAFQREVQQLVEFVRSCPTAAGVDRIRLPGDPERQQVQQCRQQGISFEEQNWEQLTTLAGKLGVTSPSV